MFSIIVLTLPEIGDKMATAVFNVLGAYLFRSCISEVRKIIFAKVETLLAQKF